MNEMYYTYECIICDFAGVNHKCHSFFCHILQLQKFMLSSHLRCGSH